MNYHELSDTTLLDYELTKIAIYEEIKELFPHVPLLLELWYQDAYHTPPNEKMHHNPIEHTSESFHALYQLIVEELADFKRMTKRVIRQTIENFEDAIRQHMAPFTELLANQMEDVSLHERDYIYANTSTAFHLMRNIVTNKKGFSEKETGYLGTELVDPEGQLHGFAELRPAPLLQTETDNEQAYWIDLLETTLSSLDELTADIFDLVSYLWMTGKRDAEGFIEFHSDDALMLRHYEKGESLEKMQFKERERFNIMRRVAALTSVWVALNNGPERLKIVNATVLDSKLYNFQDFKRMFEVGSVRIAFDKKTNKPRGIYALQIKPSSLLQPYLDGTQSTMGLLDLKVFKYSYVTQREHKRLTRYLSRQWKIRMIKGSLHQPFKVGTLLEEISFPVRLNGVHLREKFEQVLDDLRRDEVIATWCYIEPIDEVLIGKKGWIQSYWHHLNVTITPPDVVVAGNKKNQALPNMPVQATTYAITSTTETNSSTLHAPPPSDQTEMAFETADVGLTPETMRAKITALGYSLRKAADEIGVSHTTLSRYMNRKIKRQNKDNDQKMLAWFEQHS